MKEIIINSTSKKGTIYPLTDVSTGTYIIKELPTEDKRFKVGHKLLVFMNQIFNLSTGKYEGEYFNFTNEGIRVELADTKLSFPKKGVVKIEARKCN